MFTLALIAVVIALACYYIIRFYCWKFYVDKLTSNIPAWGYSFPIIGHSYKFLGNNEQLFNQLKDTANVANRLGGRVKIWMGPTLLIVTTKPDDIRTINNAYLDKPFLYNFVALWCKNGITSAPGVIWRKTIKRIHNAFSMSVIEGLNEIYNSYARKIVHNLKTESGAPPFDAATKCISFVILEAVCHTVMGVKNIDKNVVFDDYYVALKKVTQLLVKRAGNPLLYKDFMYEMTPDYRKFKNYVKTLHGLSRRVLEAKRKEIENRKKFPIIETEDDLKRYRSLLDNFLDHTETDPTLTDEQVQADVDNFIAAGYETTAVSALLVLIMIGTYPKIQDKVYEELKEIFKGSNRDVTKEDLDKMIYCEAVVNETLRMYPVVPIIMRHADKDLELDGCTIPEGAEVIDNLWGACRSRDSWGEDAEEFIPERFFRETQPDPAAFAAFSYGRRICIARKSAVVFLKIILAQCARELEFKADASKLRFEINITLHPIESGRNLQVFARN